MLTANGRAFPSPYDFQQDMDRRMESGEIDVSLEGDVETHTLSDQDFFRPDPDSLCRMFGTEGSLESVLGPRAVERVRSLPQRPATLIRPTGIYNDQFILR